MPIKHLFIILFAILCISSCKKDEKGSFPSIVNSFADLSIQENGKITHITLDNGEHIPVSNDISYKKFSKDTIYRMNCFYSMEYNNKAKSAKIYNISPILILSSKHVVNDSIRKEVESSNIDIISAWKGRYNLDLIFGIKTSKDGLHKVSIYEDTTYYTQDVKYIEFMISHITFKSDEIYNRKINASIPIKKYFNDSIKHINIKLKYYKKDKSGNSIKEDKYNLNGFQFDLKE